MVVISGARQCGKTTLARYCYESEKISSRSGEITAGVTLAARHTGEQNLIYRTLDDVTLLKAALPSL